MTGPQQPALSPAQERLQRDYRPAFLRFLSRRDEQGRLTGYELGRAAVTQGQSVLDLVAAHHVVLLEVLPDARDADETAAMCTAASEFLVEVLATFSMTSSALPELRGQLQQARDELAALRRRAEPDAPLDG